MGRELTAESWKAAVAVGIQRGNQLCPGRQPRADAGVYKYFGGLRDLRGARG